MKREKIIVVCGSFDPLTIDDLHFLQNSKKRGQWLIVGLQSDMTVHLNTGKLTQDFESRKEILENIKCVDEVFMFNDSDGTVCNLLKTVKICYPRAEFTYVSEFDMKNTPETKIRGISFEVLSKE